MPAKIRRALRLTLPLCLMTAGTAAAAGLLVAEGGFGGALEIVEHSVHVTFNNGIVVTEVEQVFRNLEDRQVEALYTFPVPSGASLADFTMWIGGKEMVGEVVEKQRARGIYESYKRRFIDPGLLEQTNFKTFEMRIFPIAARAEQRVRIAYYQELDFDHDWATYVYPLRTRHATADARAHERFEFKLDVTSEVPITRLESPSHEGELLVVCHSDYEYQASLESAGADLNRDVVVAIKLERPKTGLDLVVTRERGEDGTFQLTLTAGDELEDRAVRMDYVFIVDLSGSMAEDGKLDLARALVKAFLAELSADDRFEVIGFNVAPKTAFRALRRADRLARDEAEAFLKEQGALGGTALEPAIELAYRYQSAGRSLNVVVLTDGMTDRREFDPFVSVIRRRPPMTRVFSVGVGNEINPRFLELLAAETGGLATFMASGDDFERRAEIFRRKFTHPVGTDLAIEVEGVGIYDVEPKTLPNLYHGAPIRLYGRYRQAGVGRVHVRAVIDGQPFNRSVEFDFPRVEPANPELARMWAWRRVEALERQTKSRDRKVAVDEIVRLGEAYSIVTEHTSFLVLENDAEYQRWQIERRNALRLGRDREAQRRARERFEQLRRDRFLALGPIELGATEVTRVASSPPPRAGRPAPRVRQEAPPPRVRQQAPPPPRRRQGLDLDGAGDGVAVDPASVLLAVVMLAGLALAAKRR